MQIVAPVLGYGNTKRFALATLGLEPYAILEMFPDAHRVRPLNFLVKYAIMKCRRTLLLSKPTGGAS